MTKLIQTNRGCVMRAIAALGVVLVTGYGSLGIVTRLIVMQAEAKYPAAAFVTVEETGLHYVSEGSGRPVVFVHGGNGRLQGLTLCPVFAPIAAEFRAIAFDRPGLGCSEKPAS